MSLIRGTKGARPLTPFRFLPCSGTESSAISKRSMFLLPPQLQYDKNVGRGHSYGDSSRHGGHAPEQSVLTHRGSAYAFDLFMALLARRTSCCPDWVLSHACRYIRGEFPDLDFSAHLSHHVSHHAF